MNVEHYNSTSAALSSRNHVYIKLIYSRQIASQILPSISMRRKCCQITYLGSRTQLMFTDDMLPFFSVLTRSTIRYFYGYVRTHSTRLRLVNDSGFG